MTKRPLFLAMRWLLGAACLCVSLRFFHAATQSDMLGAFARCLLGMAALITSVVIVSPDVIPWAVSPLLHLLDSIYLPSATEPPPVDYTLARFYRKRGRLEESVQEYGKIVHYHPREAAAYVEGIRTALEAGDTEAAARLLKRGRRCLRQADDRSAIEQAYERRDEARLA